jgi:putative tricarboxylic transport membrane protein
VSDDNVPAHDGGRRPDRASLVIAALLILLAAGVAYDAATLRAGVASYSRVGPEVFPFAIAGCLAALGVATAVSAFRSVAVPRAGVALLPVALIAGGLLGQILLLNVAGFSLATGLVFAATAAALGRPKVWFTYPIGVAFSLAVWLVFAMALKLVLPAGPLEQFARAETTLVVDFLATEGGRVVNFVRSFLAAP